ncbi:MAG: glycosyltransferase, partial [Nitrososphaeria archaeon]
IHIGGTDKGADIVFDIIKLLGKEGQLNNFDFYFVGTGLDLDRYKITEPENIHILGKISELEKLKLLSSSDCIIIPAYENFPKTMLEGIASGLYVLTSKRNAAWKDFTNLGIKMFIAENGFSKEYINTLKSLAKIKRRNKNPNPYKYNNKKRIIRYYSESTVLPEIQKMFSLVEK